MCARRHDRPGEFHIARAAALIGKHVLVGLTYGDADGAPVRLVQVHGWITAADATRITLRLHGTGEEFTLPPALDAFQEAPPGEYRLRATGEIVVDPDLLVTWTITAPPDDPRRVAVDGGPPGPGDDAA